MVDRTTILMLQEQIGELQKQVKTLQNAPALRNASIEDTSIPVIDGDGRITSVIGRQEDGSSGVSVRRSPFQPMPTAPILEAGEQAGTCAVEWDGGTHFGDAVPIIFGKIEIYAVLLGEGEEPFTAPNPGAERVGSIRERAGGEVLVALPKVGTWAVWLRMVGADGQTTGLWSPAATVEISGKVDVDAIHERIDTERDRITEADERLTFGQEVLDGKLEFLDTERLPELEATLAEKASSSELDAISNGVAALTGTNAKTFIQDTEPPAMTGAVTYEWAGTPHASESVKRVDGIEMARNRVQNPSFEGSLGGLVTGSATSVSTTSSQFFVRVGDNALSAQVTGATAANGFVAQDIAISGSDAGRWLAFAVAARGLGSGPSHARLRVLPRSGSSSLGGYRNGAFFELERVTMSGVQVRSFAAQIPSGADNARLALWAAGSASGSAPQDGNFYSDAWISCVADTEQEALAQAAAYFDGDSADEAAEAGIWINTAGDNARYWWDHEQDAWVEVLDDAVFNRVVADRIFANLGVFDRLEAREGWIGGVALEDGAVKSRTVDTEEFFAAEAVIQKVWAEIVRTRLVASEEIITEDMIATGAITTPKLTVTEDMVAQIASFIRVEAGSLASNDIESMRIISSLIEATVYVIHDANNDVSVRIDGIDNLFSGRLHAGMAEGTGIILDYGERVLNIGADDNDEPDQTITWTAPYIEFDAGMGHETDPAITVDPNNGGLRISPGSLPETERFRARLSVSGDVRANRHLSGSSRAAGGHYLVNSTLEGDQSDIVGGIYRSGTRTGLRGRMPGSPNTDDMMTPHTYGGYTVTDSHRVHAFLPHPVPVGRRLPIGQVRGNQVIWDLRRQVTVSVQEPSASSFRFILHTDGNDNWLLFDTFSVWQ